MTQQRTKKKPPIPTKRSESATTQNDRAKLRDGSKSATVLDLLRQKDGATLEEMMKATGWQAHSVRGFLAGALVKKTGSKVASTKGEDGVRRYSIG